MCATSSISSARSAPSPEHEALGVPHARGLHKGADGYSDNSRTISVTEPGRIDLRDAQRRHDARDHPRPVGIRAFWKRLGPGIVTGAADDDPSGIATYSVAGHQRSEHSRAEPEDHDYAASLSISRTSRGIDRVGLHEHAPLQPRRRHSAQVRAQQVDQLLRSFSLLGVRSGVRIDDMVSHMILQDLGHQSIQRAAAGGELLEDRAAIALAVE
jgi:hypothetical protein